MNERLTLLQLNRLVRDTIEQGMPGSYWVEAELSELSESRGHCYMELIEKDSRSNTPVAKASAKCWRTTWSVVHTHFERVTGQRLAPGMKVLLLVGAQFHENYGFSWIVSDIDPTFTLGDMARKRREIIRRLKDEGVFDLNKELSLPMFARNIAVISSAGAAGYGDFCHQLENNGYGFRFTVRLFNAVMQGESVEQSVIAALNAINNEASHFDCVVIIRGGGATSDLSGFDTLALAENVANFPLPVITGIGHERDESVLDMVANTSVKTPTAAAALLIDNLKRTADIIDGAQAVVTQVVTNRLTQESLRLTRIATTIPQTVSSLLTKEHLRLTKLTTSIPALFTLFGERQLTALTILCERLRNGIRGSITIATHRMDMLEQRVEGADPKHILRRGYSITLRNGRAVTDAATLRTGDVVTTRLSKGEVTSIIKS